jgi:hypothetical protein
MCGVRANHNIIDIKLFNCNASSTLQNVIFKCNLQRCRKTVFSTCTAVLPRLALEGRWFRQLPFWDLSCKTCGPNRLAMLPTWQPPALLLRPKMLRICIWGLVTDGPWGGGSHFLAALAKAFERMGHQVGCAVWTHNSCLFVVNAFVADGVLMAGNLPYRLHNNLTLNLSCPMGLFLPFMQGYQALHICLKEHPCTHCRPLTAFSFGTQCMGHNHLQVCNIDKHKRSKGLLLDQKVDLHILVHSLTQLPIDLMEALLPKASDGGIDRPKVLFRTDGPHALTRGSFRVIPEEDKELFKLVARYEIFGH